MDCSKTCVVIFLALTVSTAGFVLTLTGWFAPPLNDFVHYVRLTGPVILLVGFGIMLVSCAMCSFVQGRCCECCYKYSHRKYSLGEDAHAHSQLGSAYHRLLLQGNHVTRNHALHDTRHCNGHATTPMFEKATPIWEKATPLQHPHAYAHPSGVYPEFGPRPLGKDDTCSLLPHSCPSSPRGGLRSGSRGGTHTGFSTPVIPSRVPPQLKLPPMAPASPKGVLGSLKGPSSPPHSPDSPSLSLSSPPPRYEDEARVWIHHSDYRGDPISASTPTRSKEFVV